MTDDQGWSWGPWQLNRSVLVLEAHGYEVDLERCLTSGAVLDWIVQVAGKTWADNATLAGLVRALTEVLNPQKNLCPNEQELRITLDGVRALVRDCKRVELP
jgi:hypothetical protein